MGDCNKLLVKLKHYSVFSRSNVSYSHPHFMVVWHHALVFKVCQVFEVCQVISAHPEVTAFARMTRK